MKKLYFILFFGVRIQQIDGKKVASGEPVVKIEPFYNMAEAKAWADKKQDVYLPKKDGWFKRGARVAVYADMPAIYGIANALSQTAQSNLETGLAQHVEQFCAEWLEQKAKLDFMRDGLKLGPDDVSDEAIVRQVNYIWSMFKPKFQKTMFPLEKEYGYDEVEKYIKKDIAGALRKFYGVAEVAAPANG